jgi:hypothetical protein
MRLFARCDARMRVYEKWARMVGSAFGIGVCWVLALVENLHFPCMLHVLLDSLEP